MFDALDFLAKLTQPIPPKRLQLICRYGLYASRTKGRWADMPYVAERAPAGWKASHPTVVPHPDGPEFEPLGDGEEISVDARKHAWVRLLAKVYKGYASQRRTARWIRSSVRSAAIKTDSREKPLFSPCGMR